MNDARTNLQALMAYWHTSVGQHIWQRESQRLSRMVTYKGGRLLEMSAAASLSALFAPRQHFRWAPSSRTQSLWDGNYIADGRAQPFDDCYFDAVVLHHVLDCVPQPHHWLSEAARITADTGRLYIVCWNPWQPRWPDRHHRHPAVRRLSIRQLKDWLAFVDLEIEQVHYCAFTTARTRLASWAERIGTACEVPIAGSYIVSARRQKQYVVPATKRLRHRQRLALGALPQGALTPKSPSPLNPLHTHTDNAVPHSISSRLPGHHEQL